MAAPMAYNAAVRAPLAELSRTLESLLSRRLTAYLAGVKDTKTVSRWSNGDISNVRNGDVEQRLRTALTIANLLRDVEDDQTVKSWFVSLNPYLGDISPAQAIRDDRGREVLEAARIFAAAN